MTADPNRMNGIAVDFIRTDKGVIKPVYANAIAFLRAHAHEIGLKFDTFSMRPFRGNGFLMEADLRHIAEIVQRSGVLASKNVIDDAVLRVCEERMFHQVAEYLNALAWDGISRISRILIDHAGAPDTELVQAQTGKWMIQAVARIFEPGCQADATLVLEGEQGLGKSTFFFDMFGAKWFTDHLPDLHNKDAMMQLRGAWCVEIAELATFTRTDAKKINQFLTTKIDRYRDPYGRLVQDFPRQTVFAGTVNPGAMGYLKDETGARRFWSIPVETFNSGAIRENRDQYWAEAVHRYRNHESWYLNNSALAADAAVAQAERYVIDPWDEIIADFVNGKEFVTLESIFTECLSIHSKADWGQPEMNRVARTLGHIGMERYRLKAIPPSKKRHWAYRWKSGTENGFEGGTSGTSGTEQGEDQSQSQYDSGTESAVPEYWDTEQPPVFE